MSAQTIISIENLSKAYPVYDKPKDVLLELLTRKPRHNLFWALRDISFSVQEKQRIGIIGPNGSGKTTLLKIITGNLPPTSGTVQVNGKVSAMLSLATAINPEETGLNNIRFNLIMNGCPNAEIEQLTEEIVDFAELGPFIYAPVKTYSAGMNARLSFTIATAIKPEILIIDEVLGAGDGYFIGKATKRMIDLCNQGKALLYVSHSLSSVQMLCDTVIWLDNGSIRNIGPVDYVTKLYEEDYRKREDEATRSGNIARKKQYTATQANPGEMEELNLYRLRLVSRESQAFKDTHYIRRITLCGDGIEAQDISLAIVDINQQDVITALDLLDSEWGRLYSKAGVDCRILTSQTGKNRGGQILLKRPPSVSTAYNIQLTFEASSILNTEKLGVDFLNYQTGEWEQGEIVRQEKLSDGWQATTVSLAIPLVDHHQYQQTLQKIKQNNRPDVEIIDLVVLADGEPTPLVNERQPFEIRVRVVANRLTPVVDVAVNIYRSDGVYVFWQSSGLAGHNLHDLEGELTVCFMFDENYFGPGDYYVGATIANGWDPVNNFPYSEVFDFKVNHTRFTIRREYELVMFGQINMRVPVKLLRQDERLPHLELKEANVH